jgi:ubiquitin fusion degradation protein 1
MSFWSSLGSGAMRPPMMPSRFEEQYHCYSVAYADKAHLEGGDKILLPPSAFDTLARLQVDYPMLFRLQSSQKGTMTHCGVLEFTADEGTCYIPFWMMQNLLIEEGSVISVTNISLPKATFVKLQPQHVDFLEITNPRAVLEHALRNFSCVTKGDVICVPYNSKNYHFELKEVKPQDAACIIETDCNVDFDAPVGYKEPTREPQQQNNDILGAGVTTSSFRNSACPSPALSSMSGTSGTLANNDESSMNINNDTTTTTNQKPSIRIVDGKIIRPDEENSFAGSGMIDAPDKLVAPKIGATGVQRNSAIAVKAPEVNYWAVNAGDGARLDGKAPTLLKDKNGQEVDIRKLRAEAAARRLEEMNKNKLSMPSVGTTVDGKSSVVPDGSVGNSEDQSQGSSSLISKPPISKRKTLVGSKYSKLKQSGGFAFEGSANSLK